MYIINEEVIGVRTLLLPNFASGWLNLPWTSRAESKIVFQLGDSVGFGRDSKSVVFLTSS